MTRYALALLAALAVPAAAQSRFTANVGDTISVTTALPKGTRALAPSGTRYVCKDTGVAFITINANRKTKAGKLLASTYFPVACGIPFPLPDPSKNLPPRCNPFVDSLVSPCLVDTTQSVPGWKLGAPCFWTRINDSSLACIRKPD